MKKYFILFTLFLILVSCSMRKRSQKKEHNIVYNALPVSWDEGIPLGNGRTGLLIWQKEGRLRFSLDCSELWDLRPMENIPSENFRFKWVYDQWKGNNYSAVQKKFDEPYERNPAPTKIPAAALEFNIESLGTVNQVILNTEKAICTVKWSNGAMMEAFVDASGECGWYRFTNTSPVSPILVPPAFSTSDPTNQGKLELLRYPQGRIEEYKDGIRYTQKGWNGFTYSVSAEWNNSGKETVGCWKIESGLSSPLTAKSTGTLRNEDFENALTGHLNWWKKFWEASSVSLPDSLLERQWYLEMYKFGSAARENNPPISLQAIWTADDGGLPPWKGDFHHDLNTELSYWPAYSSNHTDLSLGFTNWLWKNRPEFEKYTREYFNTGGLNVPGVTTLDGKPMGGWIQYAFGLTVSSWLSQHFYLQWKYTLDSTFLREEAYPWVNETAEYIQNISVKDESGMRALPLSSSPEFNDNSREAWFPSTTNFDLSLIRATYKWAAEMAISLGKQEEAKKWEKCLSEWPDLATDSVTGLLVAPGYSYNTSHRHFSHMMSVYPLGLISINGDEKEKEIIRKSIANLEKHGTDYWTGYSYAWLGNIYARSGRGDDAAKALRIFASSFCLPNSFHVNGDQSGTGKSKFIYRPFTLEGNFAFASGIQEMLLQSNDGVIRIFPAVPEEWKNASFKSLRAEGAMLVSASMTDGDVKGVTIVSEKGGMVKMANPFKNRKAVSEKPLNINNNLIVFEMKPGEIVKLKSSER
jgi:alpha-L-fucosidase 2